MMIYRLQPDDYWDAQLGGLEILGYYDKRNRYWWGYMLPGRWCPYCRIEDYYSDAADIPEMPTEELVTAIKPYLERAEKLEPVSLSEFADLEQKVRHFLKLHPKRLVLPKARIGRLLMKHRRRFRLDILWVLGDRILLSPKAAERLSESGLTGFDLFPVQVPQRAPHPVYEMIVWGDGGWPITKPEGFWKECEGCGQRWLQKDQRYAFSLNEKAWDGSDFFHFGGKGCVYITERAKRWLETSGLRHDMKFIPPERDRHAQNLYLAKGVMRKTLEIPETLWIEAEYGPKASFLEGLAYIEKCDLSLIHEVRHYLYFPGKREAEEAARILKGIGYEVRVEELSREDYLLEAVHFIVPMEETIERVRGDLKEVAGRFGGEYDGSEIILSAEDSGDDEGNE